MTLTIKPESGAVTLGDLRDLLQAVDDSGSFADDTPILAHSLNSAEPITLASLSVEGSY